MYFIVWVSDPRFSYSSPFCDPEQWKQENSTLNLRSVALHKVKQWVKLLNDFHGWRLYTRVQYIWFTPTKDFCQRLLRRLHEQLFWLVMHFCYVQNEHNPSWKIFFFMPPDEMQIIISWTGHGAFVCRKMSNIARIFPSLRIFIFCGLAWRF